MEMYNTSSPFVRCSPFVVTKPLSKVSVQHETLSLTEEKHFGLYAIKHEKAAERVECLSFITYSPHSGNKLSTFTKIQ